MRLFLLASVLSLSGASVAQTEISEQLSDEPESVAALPCRPTIACMAEIIPKGYFEVEAGYGGRVSAGTMSHSGLVLLKYSVLDFLQLQLATNNLFIAGPGLTAKAFDGVMPGIKVRLNEQGKWMPSNALSVHLAIPTYASPDAAQKTLDVQAWWYVSRDIGLLHADFNFEVTIYDVGAQPKAQALTTLALAFNLGKGWGVFTELYSTWGHAAAIPLDGGSLNGVSFAVADNLVLDVGGDIGLYWGTRAFTAFAGLTFVPGGGRKSPIVQRVMPVTTMASVR